MKKLKANQFQCAKCQNVFTRALTEEEAIAQCLEEWGCTPEEMGDSCLVCDDCYNFMTESQPLYTALARERTSSLHKKSINNQSK